MWFQNRRAKLRRQLKMQNKSHKSHIDKAEEPCNEESNSKKVKKDTENQEKANEQKQKTTLDEEEQNKKEKTNNDKKKNKKIKKISEENESSENIVAKVDHCEGSSEKLDSERNDSTNQYFNSKQRSPSEKSYDQTSSMQNQDVFDESPAMTSYSNWMVSPSKRSMNNPLSSTTCNSDGLPTQIPNHQSPPSAKSPVWGSDIRPSRRSLSSSQGLMQQPQDLSAMSRRDSNPSVSEAYSEEYSATMPYESAEEYPGNSIRDSNTYTPNCHQRNPLVAPYSNSFHPLQGSYKTPYLDRTLQGRVKGCKGGPQHYGERSRYHTHSMTSLSPSSSSPSVMAAVYMNGRSHYNPQAHYPNVTSSHHFQARAYSTYESSQQQSYANNMTAPAAYNCPNPMTI